MSKKDKCFPSNSSYESEKLVRRRREGGKGVREGDLASESEEEKEKREKEEWERGIPQKKRRRSVSGASSLVYSVQPIASLETVKIVQPQSAL